MSLAHFSWSSAGSTDSPMTLTFRRSNSGLIFAMYPSSVVQTGVKSFGCENSTAHESPIHSWKRIGPSVVCASKSGAVSPSLRAIFALLVPGLVQAYVTEGMRPIVGITTDLQTVIFGAWEEESALIPADYVRAVERAGGRPVLIPPSEEGVEETLDLLDGIVLSGGSDLDPATYGHD